MAIREEEGVLAATVAEAPESARQGGWVGAGYPRVGRQVMLPLLSWRRHDRERASTCMPSTPSQPTTWRPCMCLPQVEPKVFFANERTFLAWLNMSVTLASISVAILA
jgi:hypothetical protein